jgi:hypothetical protein
MKQSTFLLLVFFWVTPCCAQITFTDVTLNSGITTPSPSSTSFTHSWADFDNDDLWDLFIARGDLGNHQVPQVYHNLGNGKFQVITTSAFQNLDAGYYAHMCFGDFDNDGFVDVYQDAFVNSKNKLWHNNGNLTFTDASSLMKNPGSATTGTVWIDYDKDGFVDLLVNCQAGQGTAFYHNNKGKSLDVVNNLTTNPQVGDLAFATDFNQDGWMDVYLANYMAPDVFFTGGPSGFTPFDNTFLFSKFTNSDNRTNGCFADIDNDGFPEMLLADASKIALWHNDGGTGFHDYTAQVKLDGAKKSERMSFMQDIDNDGYLDVILYNNLDSSQLWYGSSAGFKKTVLPFHLADNSVPSSISWTDYDNDGFLDLMEVSKGVTSLWHNEGNVNRWLSVKLKGHQANSMGLGATVKACISQKQQYRDVGFNQGYYGYQPAMAHFGFGPPNCNSSDLIDSVVIIWQPGGRQVLKDVRMNQFIVVDQDTGIVRSYQKPVSSGMGFVFPIGLATMHTNPNKKIDLPVSVYLPQGRGIDTLAVDEITFSINYDQSMLDISPTKVAQHYTPPPGWTYKSSYTGNDTLEVTIAHTPSIKLTGDSVYLGSFNFDTYIGKYASTLVYISGLSLVTERRKFSFCTNLEGAVITRVIIDTIQASVVNSITTEPEQLHIVPNPASGDVRISWANSSEHSATLRIIDQLGREIYRSSGTEGFIIPENTLSSGSYVVEVTLTDKKLLGHLIIR